MQRQNVDVHMPPRHQHVGTADECRADDAVGHHVDLPDRRPIQNVTLDDDVADDQHGERNEDGREHAGHA